MIDKIIDKIKYWHIYGLCFLVFISSFIFLNTKYDKFYRVNGINNENRSLIEHYLSNQEQKYLIDNAIPVSKFIDYLKDDNFSLFNYEYYNVLKENGKYKENYQIINKTNVIVNKLRLKYGSNSLNKFKDLIINDLQEYYLASDEFIFDNIAYYQILRTKYPTASNKLIFDTNSYITVLKNEKISDNLESILENLTNHYDNEGLEEFFNKPLNNEFRRLYSFDSMSVVLDNTTYIGMYQPSKLIAVSNIPRIYYTMHIEKDTQKALKTMYNALPTSLKKKFILSQAYVDFESLASKNLNPGFSELQLGTSILIKQKKLGSIGFETTELFKWLEQNAYMYGFVLRYPNDKVSFTGQNFNSSLFRYVGVKIATKMKENNWSLEEYNGNVKES